MPNFYFHWYIATIYARQQNSVLNIHCEMSKMTVRMLYHTTSSSYTVYWRILHIKLDIHPPHICIKRHCTYLTISQQSEIHKLYKCRPWFKIVAKHWALKRRGGLVTMHLCDVTIVSRLIYMASRLKKLSVLCNFLKKFVHICYLPKEWWTLRYIYFSVVIN